MKTYDNIVKHKVTKWLCVIPVLALMITLLLGIYQPIPAKAAPREEGGSSVLDGELVTVRNLNDKFDKNGSSGSGDGDSGESLNGTGENGSTKTLSYLYWAGSIHRTGYIIAILE